MSQPHHQVYRPAKYGPPPTSEELAAHADAHGVYSFGARRGIWLTRRPGDVGATFGFKAPGDSAAAAIDLEWLAVDRNHVPVPVGARPEDDPGTRHDIADVWAEINRLRWPADHVVIPSNLRLDSDGILGVRFDMGVVAVTVQILMDTVTVDADGGFLHARAGELQAAVDHLLTWERRVAATRLELLERADAE